MRIGVVSSAVPLVLGGYRLIAEWLAEALIERGHEVETLYLPSTDEPTTLLRQMAAFRLLKLDPHYERVITLRPPAHAVQHRAKVVWFIHHVRMFYDLWGHSYNPLPDVAAWRALRAQLMAADRAALAEARHLFTNSQTVADRLSAFNGLAAEVLYPPVARAKRFWSGPYGDEILCVCRMELHKRQHLLIEALAHCRSGVRLRLCGSNMNPDYLHELGSTAERLRVADRVVIEPRWIDEEQKVDLLAKALAVAYVPFDEDSYGYPTVEAAHARRCTLTVSDAGGVLEFVRDGVTGLEVAPTPEALASAFDRLWLDRALAKRLGEAAHNEIARLGIDWDHVVTRILS